MADFFQHTLRLALRFEKKKSPNKATKSLKINKSVKGFTDQPATELQDLRIEYTDSTELRNGGFVFSMSARRGLRAD